ncbi:MAG TPA: DUF3142 domain-containing protein [Chthoniobacteraceae bacterium]|nr:DUF3142 domain-containing protein [Chthoniobacteraceae bacterium]
MPQEIYVWQRVWNEQVEAALLTARDAAAGFAVLTAEIDVREQETKIVRPNVSFAALKSSGRPIALAIRVDPFAGPFRAHDRVAQAIVKLARDEVARARSHEFKVHELQIDFDCGEAKLDGYRTWLKEIRAAVRPLPVVPTVLPSWLKRREFATLARESGRFILQVHSVSVPQRVEDTRKLTDPREAAAWVEQAARVGVPFRVSLPTYSYLVAFDAEGKMCGISAEGSAARWPREAARVRWEAQPDEMAGLIAQWTRARPAMLRGVFWYRLPVASDNLNWSRKTLAVAMQGRAPKSDLRVVASDSQPSEIVAMNDGEKDEPLPEWIEARWNGSKLIAADALQGYEMKASPDADSVRFELTGAGKTLRLPPDARRNVGWIRCEPPTPIQVSMPARAVSSDVAPVVARDRH